MYFLADLDSQFPGRAQNEYLWFAEFQIDILKCWQDEGSSLSGAGLGDAYYIASGKCYRYGFGLHRRGGFKSQFADAVK